MPYGNVRGQVRNTLPINDQQNRMSSETGTSMSADLFVNVD